VPHPTHKSISLPDDVVCESWSKMMRISHLSGVWRAVAAYSVLCEAGYVIIFHDQAMTEFLFSKSFTSSAVKQYSNIQQQRLRFHSRDLHCRNSSTDAASTCTVQSSTVPSHGSYEPVATVAYQITEHGSGRPSVTPASPYLYPTLYTCDVLMF